jgi:type II secretory pathway pseudopilin PulG
MVTTRRGCRGFTYLTALFVVALMGAGYATIGEMWATTSMRDKEDELLYIGNQYRRAIERYYATGPRRYPRTLQDLLKDPRAPTIQRYIRQLYADPMTGSTEWGLVKAPDGGIMGVHSTSQEAPIKQATFKLRDAGFEAAKTYADWKFIFTPAQATTKPAATAPATGAQPKPSAPVPPPAK